MKKIVPHCLKPQDIDLSSLEENHVFRSDLLFFIRLAGTHAQTLFWQGFPRSAMARRKKMFSIAKKAIPKNKAHFRSAVLDPKCRHTKTTDIFHKGFLSLLRKLQEDESLQKIFADGFKQQHGIFWRFEQFNDAIEILIDKRHYLEHYAERKRKRETFNAQKNTKVLEALSILLLPGICNMLEMRARSVKEKTAQAAADGMHTLFEWCRQENAESRRLMFSEERKRARIGKTRRKALATDADNTAIWLKSYRALGISPTDYREFQFKRRYDFIGPQNLRAIFECLGLPLQKKSRALIYTADHAEKPSFRHDIEPLYMLTMHIGAVIHHYIDFAPKDKKGEKIQDADLHNIRNTLAHNGLFWRIYAQDNKSPLTVEDVFAKVLASLPTGQKSTFCDQIERLLRRENHAVMHTSDDGHPKTEKIRRWSAEKRAQAKQEKNSGTEVNRRRAVRKIAAGWMRALQHAGQSNGLQRAGKNAT